MQKKPIACIPSSAWIQYVHRWNGNGTDAKDATNTEKHGISFAEALQVFTDTDGIEKEDLAHSSRTEQRLWRTGKMKSGRIITVVYTLSGDRLRLISAQERRRERREYEKAKKEKSD